MSALNTALDQSYHIMQAIPLPLSRNRVKIMLRIVNQLSGWLPLVASQLPLAQDLDMDEYDELVARCASIQASSHKYAALRCSIWAEEVHGAAALLAKLNEFATDVFTAFLDSVLPKLHHEIDSLDAEAAQEMVDTGKKLDLGSVHYAQKTLHLTMLSTVLASSLLLSLDDSTWPPERKHFCPPLLPHLRSLTAWIQRLAGRSSGRPFDCSCLAPTRYQITHTDACAAISFISDSLIHIQPDRIPHPVMEEVLDLACLLGYYHDTPAPSASPLMQLVLLSDRLAPDGFVGMAFGVASLALFNLDAHTHLTQPKLVSEFLHTYCYLNREAFTGDPHPDDFLITRALEGCWSRDQTLEPLCTTSVKSMLLEHIGGGDVWDEDSVDSVTEATAIATSGVMAASLRYCLRLVHVSMLKSVSPNPPASDPGRIQVRDLICLIVDEATARPNCLGDYSHPPPAWWYLQSSFSMVGLLSAVETLLRDSSTFSTSLMNTAYTLVDRLYTGAHWPDRDAFGLVITIHKRLLMQPAPSDHAGALCLECVAESMRSVLAYFDREPLRPEEAHLDRVYKVVAESLRVTQALLLPPSCPVSTGPSWETSVRAHELAFPGSGQLLRRCCNVACTNLAGLSEAALPGVKACSCKKVRYCGDACQRADWVKGGHRHMCTARVEVPVVAAVVATVRRRKLVVKIKRVARLCYKRV